MTITREAHAHLPLILQEYLFTTSILVENSLYEESQNFVKTFLHFAMENICRFHHVAIKFRYKHKTFNP